ncbi:MAG: GGDEF domain-containing protein [Candidatus Pacebacteria bacterium]|nr:GGDEF domain-containing protein [Candidatus Paceibacterota bacterium]
MQESQPQSQKIWPKPKRKGPPPPLNKIALNNEKHEQEKRNSKLDFLTGAFKSELLEPRLNELINELNGLRILEGGKRPPSNRVGFMVIFLDLDGFKEINDNFGHQAGDQALVLFGERLYEILKRKEIDRVYRYGGDEFVIVLPIESEKDVSDQELKALFERKKREVNEDLFTKDGIKIEASMGYAIFRKDDKNKTPEMIIKEADDEMYINKKDRKLNQVK